VNACIQHIIWLFANRTTVRKLLALLQQCGIRDHPDGSAGGKKMTLLSRSHTAWQTAGFLQQFGWNSLGQATKIFRNKSIYKKIN